MDVTHVPAGVVRTADDQLGAVDARNVRVIDAAYVVRAAAIEGSIDFARRQRKPSGRRRAAGRESERDAGRRRPRDHRRRVDRPREVGARHPSPAPAILDPAAVVEGGKTPWFVPDPAPAPGGDPDPVSAPVRRPVGGDAARCPQRAVLGRFSPVAPGVEIVGAGHFGRNVAGRHAGHRAPVARGAPVHEIVADGG